jgi:hypothetical protein
MGGYENVADANWCDVRGGRGGGLGCELEEFGEK